jgi:16S rRNA processing protein RimM
LDDLICVGAIMGAFGVHGEVRLKSFTADPEAIATYAPLLTQDGRVFKVQLTRQVANGFAARLSDVRSRDDAEALKGTQLFVPRARLPSLPDDEFYHADLVDLEVRDTGGTLLGRVKSVQNHGAGDILEVQAAGKAGTILLPFTLAVVPNVDLTAGRIVVDPPEGLLD